MAAVKRYKLRRGNAYEFAIYSSILIETLGQCVSLQRLSHSTGDEACLATGTAEMVVSCCLVLVWFTVAASHPHFHPPSAPAFSLSLSLSLSLNVCGLLMVVMTFRIIFIARDDDDAQENTRCVKKRASFGKQLCLNVLYLFNLSFRLLFSGSVCMCCVLWALVAWNKNKMKWLREIKCLFIHSFIHSFKL